MKQIAVFLVVVLLVCVSSPLFSTSTVEPDFYDVSMMLNNTKKLTDVQISLIGEKAANLSPQQRYMLFESHKQSATMPFVLNFIVGAGIGSFVQGDTKGGTIGLIADLASLGMILTGYAQGYSAALEGDYSGTEGSVMVTVGGALSLASRIYQLVRPFTYAKEHNRKLANSLEVNFAALPVVGKQGDLQMRVASRVSF